MNILISQIIALITIIIIGYIVFKYFPFKVTTKDISLTAFLVVASVVLSYFSLMIPLFGFMSFKIGFSQMPLMILGVILGPGWAFIGAIVQDLLDIMINPSGFPFLGFTLNKILIATVPALWFCKWNKLTQKQTFKLIWLLLFGIYTLTMIGIWSATSITVSSSLLVFTIEMKLLLSLACSAVMIILIILMLYFKRKYPFETSRYHIANWIVCVLLIEIIVQLTLTPIWLDIMYGIPYIMNVLVRMVKSSFMIFLNITLGYYVLRLVTKLRKDPNGLSK